MRKATEKARAIYLRTEKHLEIAKDLRLDSETEKQMDLGKQTHSETRSGWPMETVIWMRLDSRSDWQMERLKAIYSVTEKETPKGFVKETHSVMD